MTQLAEAALARLCQEARDLPVPELDTATIEAKVLDRVKRATVDSVVVPRRRRWLATRKIYGWSAVAVAAAGIGLILNQWPQGMPNSVATRGRGVLIHSPGEDGDLLTVGETIEASQHEITIRHRGIITWRLSTSGRARIVEQGPRVTLALERGRIEAEVVPQPVPEVFAVEVGSVRVAVHGTVFAVERHDDAAEVVVSEGRVRLGTSDQRGNTQGEILAAPMRRRIEVLAPPVAPLQTSPASAPTRSRWRNASKPYHSTSNLPPASAPIKSVAEPNLSESPSPADVEHLWDVINREVSLCFAEQPADPNVRVSFSTKISVLVEPNGSVTVTNFEPPLAESFYRCITQQTAELRTTPSRVGAFLRREKMLMR